MATRKGEVKIQILGDDSHLDRVLGQTRSKLGTFGSAVGGVAKAGALALGGLAVGAGIAGKSFYDAAIESQKVTKQTEAVIQSMGNKAGVTADQVAKLSTKLSMQTGVDDELIQSGQNVLLTFANVQNAVGDGPKNFDRATKAALNMSVALGQDMTSASMMVGKALNDPTKGLSKLARSGIQFTKQQEEQIKTMQAAGDMAGAQAIMLEELERQFGGSAEAQATAGDKLKVVWGNLQETIGAKLIPVVEKAATWLADKLPAGLEAVEEAIGPVIAQVGAFWNTLTSGFTENEGTPVEKFALKVREWIPRIMEAVRTVVEFIQANWPKISAVISSVASTIGTVVSGLVTVITVLWENFGNNILSFVQRVWPAISQVIQGALTIIRGIVQTVTSLIQGDWSGVWNGIKGIVSGAWNAIQGIVKAAIEAVRFVIGVGMEVVGSALKGAWNGIVGWLTGLPGRVGSALSGMWNGITNGFKSALNGVIRLWNDFKIEFEGYDIPGPGPNIPGFTIDTPNIPYLARGGVVSKPTLAVLGDAKGPDRTEIATPEKLLRTIVREEGGGGGGGSVVQIENFHAGDRATPDEIARSFAWLVRTGGVSNGRG